jgi:hypothetical protein
LLQAHELRHVRGSQPERTVGREDRE